MLSLPDKAYRLIAQGMIAAIGVLVVMTFRDYGITWDEELQSQYGLAIVDYYASFFKDDRYREIFNLYLYGGMFDGLASAIDMMLPFSIYETRHLVNALFGMLGLWGTWRVGRLIGGGFVGVAAMGLLALTPMYYGHMFNNPKDIPFAAGIVWTLYYMGRVYAALPNPSRHLLVKLGIVFGLTLGVRVGGAMLFVFWLVPLGGAFLRAAIPSSPREGWKKFVALAGVVLPIGLIAYGVMLICWPWAQQSPILNPLRALSEFSNFPQDVEVLLNGTIYRSTQLPWTYVPLYFGAQLPLLVLGLLVCGGAFLPRILGRLDAARRQMLVVLLMMMSIPILYAVLRHPALYDAVRHFLFAVPLACVVAALAARDIAVWAIGHFRHSWARRSLSAAIMAWLAVAAGAQIAMMRYLHPYEYIYANVLVGGVQGAYGRYETDYWGSSFKEAAERLQTYVTQHGGVPNGKIYRVAICGPWAAATIYLPPNYEAVEADKPADFFLSTTRWMCQDMREGREIIRVERFGVPLSIVKVVESADE